jgi:hypothetical protein
VLTHFAKVLNHSRDASSRIERRLTARSRRRASGRQLGRRACGGEWLDRACARARGGARSDAGCLGQLVGPFSPGDKTLIYHPR